MTDLVENRIEWLRWRASSMGVEDWIDEVRTALEGRVEAENLYRAEKVRANRLRAATLAPAAAQTSGGMLVPAEAVSRAELIELILWLALPYAEGDPVFEVVDPYSRQPLPENARLARAWHLIVRGRLAPESPGMDPGGSEVIP